MANRFVRSSKYRHVFGRSTKKEQCYDNLRISKNAWDTNLIKVNPTYLSVNWEASGGGTFAVIPLEERGRLPEQFPLFRGHTAAVLDTDWNPFNDSIISSGSDDGKVFVWKVPKNFTIYSEDDTPHDIPPSVRLSGHSRKVGHVLFNPAAANVLASASGDCSIKLWDIEKASANLALKHPDIVQSLSWSANGSLLVTTCRDKKLRIWDVRQEKPAHEVPGHQGAKNSRAVWMGEHDRVATTGFSRMSDRQLGLWDIRDPQAPIGDFQILDSISGVCMPFWDEGTQCLYLAGKGDGNIRYYEYENDKFEYLSEYKSMEPQRGIAFLPKRGINVHENEVMRCFKTVNDSYVEPVSFVVPRRAEVFQHDIYPPTIGTKPAMSADEWFGGKTGLPPKISLEAIYDGGQPVEVEEEEKQPAFQPLINPLNLASKPAEASKPTPAPVPVTKVTAPEPAQWSQPTSLNDNKASMANMASKFADKNDEPERDSHSGFDEQPRRVQRPAATTSAPAPAPTKEPTKIDTDISHPDPRLGGIASPATEGLKGVLSDLRSLVAAQSKQITEQTELISQLALDVSLLKARVGEESAHLRPTSRAPSRAESREGSVYKGRAASVRDEASSVKGEATSTKGESTSTKGDVTDPESLVANDVY